MDLIEVYVKTNILLSIYGGEGYYESIKHYIILFYLNRANFFIKSSYYKIEVK